MAGLLPLTQQESELRIADFLLDVPPYGAAHGATRCTDRSVARDAAGRASSLNMGMREDAKPKTFCDFSKNVFFVAASTNNSEQASDSSADRRDLFSRSFQTILLVSLS